MTGLSLSRKSTHFYHDESGDKSADSARQTGAAGTHDEKSLVCRDCGAVHQNDRWSWCIRPVDSAETLCPACLRIQDRAPAGILTIRGIGLSKNRDAVLQLIRSTVNHIGKQHPLKRIMDMECDDTEAVFTFTDAQMTHQIGEALQQSYEGVIDYHDDSEKTIITVICQR